MSIKIIKSKKEHEQAMKQLRMLAAKQPARGTADSDKIDVLALLIHKYESEKSSIELPSPISAIQFRMDQKNLTRKDLAVYLGSLSRVSEVLSGKKPLNLTMIRNLHEGLGIPYDVLMQKTKPIANDYSAYPLNAIYKAGYFDDVVSSFNEFKSKAKLLIDGLFIEAGRDSIPAELRSSVNSQSATKKKVLDEYALSIWQAQVLKLAKQNKAVKVKCDISAIDDCFLGDILKLSQYDDGPLRAKKKLAKNGIHLIILPHLPKTYLDGAAMLGCDGNPIIGMTLRYDRLDNFWFVLMHELAHVSMHLKKQTDFCYDDMDNQSTAQKEKEADEMALEALMPETEWKRIKNLLVSPNAVVRLANQLNVSPAIIAGRYRKDEKDYRIFNRLIGSKQVRQLFGI